MLTGPDRLDRNKPIVIDFYDTPGQLLSAADRLLTDPSHRAVMSRCGRAAFDASWSPGPHLRRYHDIIEGVRLAR